VQQRNHHRHKSGFLATMGGGRGSKYTRRFTFHLALEPEACRRIDELLHLRSHIAVAGWRANEHAVSGAQVVERADRNVPLLLAHLTQIFVVSGFLEHDVELFHPTEEHFGSFHRFSAFFDSLCQLKNMPIKGVVDDEDFHFFAWC
jgi:hypothetical protein